MGQTPRDRADRVEGQSRVDGVGRAQQLGRPDGAHRAGHRAGAAADDGVRTGASFSRRTTLVGGAALGAAVTVGVAGCVNGIDDPTMSETPNADGALIPLDEVPVGGVATVRADGKPAFVARPTSQSVTAFSAICTHRGCTVREAGEVLYCPCHGSQFELLTGAVLRGPATQPLPPIEVHLASGEVYLGER